MIGCDRESHVRVTKDRLAVLLDCTVDLDDLDPLLTQIENRLASLELADSLSRDELEQRLRQAAENDPNVVQLVLIEGETPLPPKDGVIEWTGDFFRSGFVVDDETGSVDYRRRLEQRSVDGGQLLARVIPPQEGTNGRDVFGKSIPVGKPKQPHVRAGANVRWDAETNSFYADSTGRVRWISNVVSVDSVYSISGSVGLETGDISHPGAVVVGQDIEAGAKVQADGDIDVGGIVESAEIETGGNLTVQGGITGSHGKKIKASGRVHAKYVVETSIEAGGDVGAEREIRHSDVKTLGAVIMPAGRIVGGEVTALGGFDVGEAGSKAMVPTVLIAAVDYRLEAEVGRREKEIQALDKNIKRIRATVGPLMARQKALSNKQREAATELLMRVSQMEGRIGELKQEIEALKAASKALAKPEILIRQKLYPETVLCIGAERLHVRKEFPGPVRAVIGKDRNIELQPTHTR